MALENKHSDLKKHWYNRGNPRSDLANKFDEDIASPSSVEMTKSGSIHGQSIHASFQAIPMAFPSAPSETREGKVRGELVAKNLLNSDNLHIFTC